MTPNDMKNIREIIDKSYNAGYKDAIDKACEWLENKCENKGEYIGGLFGGPCSISIRFENISKDLRKAMEE